MGSDDIHLRDYWELIVRRRAMVLTCLIIATVVVTATGLATRPVYKATTILQIEPDTPDVVSFEELFQADATDNIFYQTQYRLIESRNLARRVIDREALLSDPDLGAAAGSSGGSPSRLLGWVKSLPGRAISGVRGLLGTSAPSTELDMATRMGLEDPRYISTIGSFLARLEVEPIRNTRLVSVSWSGHDPITVSRVTNSIASAYRNMNLEAKFETTEQASQFLMDEIENLQRQIAEDEAELERYGNERDILSADERQDTVTQSLTDLSSEFIRAQTSRVQAETYYEQLRDADPSTVPEVFTNSLVVRLKGTLADMQSRAAEMSRQFTEDWPALQRLRQEISDQEALVATEEERIFGGLVGSALNSFETAVDREDEIGLLLEQQRDEATRMNRDLIAYRSLLVQVDSNKSLLESFMQRQSETGVSARLQGRGTSNIRIIDPATVPRSASSPNLQLNLVLSAITGLLLGVGLAFFQEYLDNTLNTPEDVERRIGVPSLALIPSLSSLAKGSKGRYEYGYAYHASDDGDGNYSEPTEKTAVPELVSSEHPRSALAETYRTLRTSVLLANAGEPPKIVLVTSAVPGEGKTTTAINLAISMAQTGKKILIVDADMRRPRLGDMLNLDSERGVVHYLAGSAAQLKDVVQTTDIDNLWAIPCGPRPPNPAELLTGERSEAMFDTLRNPFNMIIIDSPPVMAAVDALVIAPWTDGVVLVAHGGSTPYPLVEDACRRLQDVRGQVMGISLNNVNLDSPSYQGYYRKTYRPYARAEESSSLDESPGRPSNRARIEKKHAQPSV